MVLSYKKYQINTLVKCIANNSGLIGRITAEFKDGFYQVKWSNGVKWLVRPNEILEINI